MKKRAKLLIGGITLALVTGSMLNACAIHPDLELSAAAPDLQPMTKASDLFNQDDQNAISVPDVYRMYDDLDSLVKGSDLIALGRVSSFEKKVVRLRADGEAFLEMFNEDATMFEIRPITLIKGDIDSDVIHMASFPSIAKNTIAESTVDLYEGENVAPVILNGNIALFFLKNVGDMYFPVNVPQGFVPVLGEKLMPASDNSAILPDTELPDIIDSIRYLMNFLDEPTSVSYRPFMIEAD